MNQEELEKKVHHIQIQSRKAVMEILAGEYRSGFKGMGVEFEDIREYQHGDDVRTMDWNVTARTGTPHVKLFMEERELTLMFLVDVSGSGDFGSGGKTKREVAAQLFALLAFASSHNNDNVGLILFSDQIELYVKPGKGRNHVMAMIHQILGFEPGSTKTNIRRALKFLGNVRRKRCITFLFSDFMDKRYSRALGEVANEHDLVCIRITDKHERDMPRRGLFEVIDAETGAVRILDCNNAGFHARFRENAQKRHRELVDTCHEIGADLLEICTAEDYLIKIIEFFRTRRDRSADARA